MGIVFKENQFWDAVFATVDDRDYRSEGPSQNSLAIVTRRYLVPADIGHYLTII